jgi:hypothetical protein
MHAGSPYIRLPQEALVPEELEVRTKMGPENIIEWNVDLIPKQNGRSKFDRVNGPPHVIADTPLEQRREDDPPFARLQGTTVCASVDPLIDFFPDLNQCDDFRLRWAPSGPRKVVLESRAIIDTTGSPGSIEGP